MKAKLQWNVKQNYKINSVKTNNSIMLSRVLLLKWSHDPYHNCGPEELQQKFQFRCTWDEPILPGATQFFRYLFLFQWSSSCGPQTSSMGNTWELVGNANSPSPPQTYWIRHAEDFSQQTMFSPALQATGAHSYLIIKGTGGWDEASVLHINKMPNVSSSSPPALPSHKRV